MTPFFEKLWNNYQSVTPKAEQIRNTLNLDNYEYFNDHVAFRTLNIEGHGIQLLAAPFIKEGYKQCGTYFFEEKKLNAVHLESITNPLLPKVFISEILLEEFSPKLQKTLTNCFRTINIEQTSDDILTKGRTWDFEHSIFSDLSQESEYAAWIYAHGYRVNHFTIRINSLNNKNIDQVCFELIKNGISLNDSGGVIKGSEKIGLKQASTIADNTLLYCKSTSTEYPVPSCYVEFAERFEIDGKQYNGFVTKSANHIFESTNKKKKH
jgi:hypothetical protein